MKMKIVIGMIAVLAIANMSFGALGYTLMSEDFEGFTAGSLGAQDSSWSVYNGGATSVYDLAYTSAPDWPLTTMGAYLGGVFPSGTQYVVNTKTLAPTQVPIIDNLVDFDMDYYANAWNLYHGNQSYVTLAKADGTPIVQFANYRYSDVTYMQLDGVDFDPVADFVPFTISLNFATQTARIAVSGVDQGIEVAFLNSAACYDLARIDFQAGGYYSGNGKTFVAWVDNLQLSVPVPEPATISLLLGALGFLRRKH